MKRFYISDWHYDHKNILSYDNRPFFTVAEMNQSLVERWNKAVGKDDLVYILGDMFWCTPKQAVPILDELNGQKFLVKGNHDNTKYSEFAQRFVKIDEYMEVDDEGSRIVLCHYPIPCFKNHARDNWYHLYGHVHNSFEWQMMEHDKWLMEELYEQPCKMYNVGAMMPYMDYTPRTLDEILKGAAANEENRLQEVR